MADYIDELLVAYPNTTAFLKKENLLGPFLAVSKLIEETAADLKPETGDSLRNETYRLLHRIKCVLDLRNGDYESFCRHARKPIRQSQFKALSKLYKDMDAQALKKRFFYIMADSLKLNPIISKRLTREEQAKLPKDSVDWLAHMLSYHINTFQELAPLFTAKTSSEISHEFKNFIHFRSIYLAENAPELMIETIPSSPENAWLFCIENAYGFHVTAKTGQHGEILGATLDTSLYEFYNHFLTLLIASDKREVLIERLNQLYLENARDGRESQIQLSSALLARLCCMLERFDISDRASLHALTQKEIHYLESLITASEELKVLKFTFLPKLISAIKEANQGIRSSTLLEITITILQCAQASTQGNQTVPLFSLAINKEFCELARHLPAISAKNAKGDPLFHLETVDGFTNLAPTEHCKEELEKMRSSNNRMKTAALILPTAAILTLLGTRSWRRPENTPRDPTGSAALSAARIGFFPETMKKKAGTWSQSARQLKHRLPLTKPAIRALEVATAAARAAKRLIK